MLYLLTAGNLYLYQISLNLIKLSKLGGKKRFLPAPSPYSLFPVADGDVCKSKKRLQPSKYVRLGVPGFVIKGSRDIWCTLLKHIFNLSLYQQQFASCCK
jgi:hypothetical protein